MTKRRNSLLQVGVVLALLATTAGFAVAEQAASAATTAMPERALLDRYCVTCHNERLLTAGLQLDIADVTDVSADPALWEKVVRKLRAGAMPPAPRPRPDEATYARFIARLETELDAVAAADPNPGRTEAFHRLNRAEYRNVIRDLLALDVDVAELLPADDGSYGFDNIAGVLGVSPTLLERYLSAAKQVSRLAIGNPDLPPTALTFRRSADDAQDARLAGLPFGTRGGMAISYNFPVDAEYRIRVRLSRDTADNLAPFTDRHELDVSLDGEHLRTFTVGEPAPEGASRTSPEYREWRARQRRVDDDWVLRVPVPAGPRTLRVAFRKKTSAYAETLRQPYLRPYTNTTGGDTRYQPYLESVVVTGPYEASDAPPTVETPSRARIFTCRPPACDEAAARVCAREILSTLARRAYRRPVTERDLDVLLSFYDDGLRDGGFEAGIELGLRRLLAGPEFLFRVVRDPAEAAPGTNYRLADLELASRLSFFLWSSIPDDELLDAAVAGRLQEPEALQAQVRRMLADERASALVENFAGQWLYLRNVPALVPDENRFPDFGEALRRAMQRETELFVESVLREDRSVLDLLTADYTFVNERLARHYDIPNVYGSHFRRVALPDATRRGLARPRQHPGRHRLSDPHVAGSARQVGAGEPARHAAAAAAARRAVAGGDDRRGPAALHARGDGAAPRQPGLLELPPADGSARLRAGAVRRGRQVPPAQRGRCADRRVRRPAGRHGVRGRGGTARRAPEAARPVRDHAGREASDLRPRPGRRALRLAGHSRHRPRRRTGRLPVLVDHPGHRRERALPDEEIRIMIITKMALPRRTFLRGLGATVALPLLDAMVPALSAISKTAAAPVKRLGFIYLPNGAVMQSWTPQGEGTDLRLSPTLDPLAPFHDQTLVYTRLAHGQAEPLGDGNGEHSRASSVWLNGVHPRHTEGADVRGRR